MLRWGFYSKEKEKWLPRPYSHPQKGYTRGDPVAPLGPNMLLVGTEERAKQMLVTWLRGEVSYVDDTLSGPSWVLAEALSSGVRQQLIPRPHRSKMGVEVRPVILYWEKGRTFNKEHVIIRHVNEHFYLPERNKDTNRGFTFVKPAYGLPNDNIPRTYSSEQAARRSLNYWLKGPAEVDWDDGARWYKGATHDPTRKKEDWVIDYMEFEDWTTKP